MKAPKYITRVDVAWRVKVRHYGIEKTKHFNFDKYGGVKLALNAAIDWRDQLLTKYGRIDYLNRVRSPALSCKIKVPTRPCIGVYFADNRNWVAACQINKNYIKKSFSINRYGNELAFLLACEARFIANGKLIVINKEAMPCKPEVPYTVTG